MAANHKQPVGWTEYNTKATETGVRTEAKGWRQMWLMCWASRPAMDLATEAMIGIGNYTEWAISR